MIRVIIIVTTLLGVHSDRTADFISNKVPDSIVKRTPKSAEDIFNLDIRPHIELSQYALLANKDNQEEPQANIPANITLTLECTGNRPLDWYLEHSCCGIAERINVSEKYTPNAGSKSFYSKLEIFTSQGTDTGRYYCFYNGTDDYIQENENATYQTIYIYVNDPFEKLAYPGMRLLPTISSKILVIPCRPTDSHLNVTLWKKTGDSYTHIEQSSKVMYHSTVGFLVFEPTPYFHDIFTCKVGNDTSIDFNLHYRHDRGRIPAPTINTTLSFYPMINKSFEIHCYIESQTGDGYDLQWKTPNKNCQVKSCSRITVSDLATETINTPYPMHKTSIHLKITQAQKEDTGPYTCEAMDHFSNRNSVSKDIVIHETDQDHYINIKLNAQIPTTASLNETVKVIAKVESTIPTEQLTLSWDKDGKPLKSIFHVFTINNTYKGSVMISKITIFNLKREDSGIYTLTASGRYITSNASVAIYPTAPPLLTVVNPLNFYVSKREYQLQVDAVGYPRLDVWWQWKKCDSFYPRDCQDWMHLNMPNSSNPNFIGINPIETLGGDHVRSSIMVEAIESGIYRCNGKTENGTNSTEFYFTVSDIANTEIGYEFPSYKGIVEGDNPILTCRANKLKYQITGLAWKTNNSDVYEEIVEKESDYILRNYETSHSRKLELEMRNVRINQSGDYQCILKQLPDDADYENLTTAVVVKSLIKPKLMSNDTRLLELPHMGTGSLNCTVSGRPTPSIVWLKDGRQLNKTNLFEITNQGRKLRIKFADRKVSSGTYVCKAWNRGGAITQSYTVKVAGEEEESKVPVIVLSIFLPVSSLALIILGAFFAKSYCKKRKEKQELEALSHMLFDKGQIEMINPNLPLDDQVELLPYDHKWEFPKDRLKLGRILGQGAFGRVVRAEAVGIEDGEATTTVAVKMLKERADSAQKKALMAELKILIHLGKHLNIVNLLGAVTKDVRKGELMVIVEYCRYGNMRNYLLRHKHRFINQLDPKTGLLDPDLVTLPNSPISATPTNTILNNPLYGQQAVNYADLNHDSDSSNMISDGRNYTNPNTPTSPPPGIFRWLSVKESDYQGQPATTCDLICFAFQCARGMEYLASRNLIHRDLAARNVLLADDNIVKICDFGLAKDCYKYNNYVPKGNGLMPIKWMAVESLADKVFTSKSDVWSFGILLWEFFTLGGDPYPGTEIDEEFYKKLKGGYRMEKPEYCPNDLYELIRKCWNADPDLRPSFTSLSNILGDLLEQGVRQFYMDLDTKYVNINALVKDDYLAMCTSDYLCMSESPTTKETIQYDNITSVRPVGDGPINVEPMELVPMIQLEPVHVHWKKDHRQEISPPESPTLSFDENEPLKSDYLHMTGTLQRDKSEFSRHRKGNESQRSDASSGFHSDLDNNNESNTPPPYKIVIEEFRQGVEV